MRVFIIGTGRCGTVTFSKACQYITNFSSGHETKAGCCNEQRWLYPDNHIEIDPHLAWTLGSLITRYPDAHYIHLQRHRDDVVRSWARRGVRVHRGAAPLIDVIFQTNSSKKTAGQYKTTLGLLYDVVNDNIRTALTPVSSQHIWLHKARREFPKFWDLIKATGNKDKAAAEFDKVYNAS